MEFMTVKKVAKLKDLPVKPFLKWAGGKAQILSDIRDKYPAGLGDTITKYAEPFVGGGAVLFDVLSNYKLEQVYISDINRELISTYQTVRDNVNALIDRLTEIESEYLTADENKRKDLYYFNRDRFNVLKLSNDVSIELAAMFIFLNRTCFNGLYRVNSKGAFNVPHGSYKKPRICYADNLRSVSAILKNVRIVCGDYKESDTFIDENTFAYFDPPYRSLSSSNSASYMQDGFDDVKQIELARFIYKVSGRGAHIVATLSDKRLISEHDEFIKGLYARYETIAINANRVLNTKKGWKELNAFLVYKSGEIK